MSSKMRVKARRMANGRFEVNGVVFTASSKQDAIAKYLRRKG